MEIEIVEFAALLLNYNKANYDNNANIQHVELRAKDNHFELVYVITDHNGYCDNFVQVTGELSEVIAFMKSAVRRDFERWGI